MAAESSSSSPPTTTTTRHVVFSTWNEALNEKYPQVLQYRSLWRNLGYDVQITPNTDIRHDVVRLQQEVARNKQQQEPPSSQLSNNNDYDFLNMFDSLETTNMQFDYWRYAKLYLDGGIYADVDVRPLVEIAKWDEMARQRRAVVVFEESPPWARNSSVARFLRPAITNLPDYPAYASCMVIAGAPRMSFFLHLLRSVHPERWKDTREPRKTLMTVGPGLLTEFVKKKKKRARRDDEDVIILVQRPDARRAYRHQGFGTWKPMTTLAWEQMRSVAIVVLLLVVIVVVSLKRRGKLLYYRRKLSIKD